MEIQDLLGQEVGWWFKNVFVHVESKKNVHVELHVGGRKDQNVVHLVVECPLYGTVFLINYPHLPPVDLYLIFEKSNCENQVRRTEFLASKK